MELNVDGQVRSRSPRDIDILDALDELYTRADGFVILSRAEEDYVQTNGEVVEVRDCDGHLRTPHPLNPARIREAFLGYYHQDVDWRRSFEWTPLEEADAGGGVRLGLMALIFLLAAAAGFVVILIALR